VPLETLAQVGRTAIAIGIYVFLRTVMCSPVRASQIARALMPPVSVVRRLEELMKHGYVERVDNAYRVTDKVNIPELQNKLQRRIDMVTEAAKRLAELGGCAVVGPQRSGRGRSAPKYTCASQGRHHFVDGAGSSSTTSLMIVARSAAHCSTVIGRSLMMYLPRT
jgi:hypothetical protein